jgi:hypothetical protein
MSGGGISPTKNGRGNCPLWGNVREGGNLSTVLSWVKPMMMPKANTTSQQVMGQSGWIVKIVLSITSSIPKCMTLMLSLHRKISITCVLLRTQNNAWNTKTTSGWLPNRKTE